MFLIPWLLRFGAPERIAKILAPLIVLAVIAATYVGTYFYGEHVKEQQWKAKIEAYDVQMKQVQADADAKINAMVALNTAKIKDLEDRLKASEERKAKVQTLIKEVVKYVTPTADSRCQLTAGFTGMYNSSIGTEVPGLPAGQPVDVDAPSGLALSTVAAIAAANNAECVARGEVIAVWQDWYTFNRDLWQKTKASMPKEPALPH